jgi:signal transduction histidine kinase
MKRFWPQSLMGQLLAAVAIALMFAQGFSSILLYRAQSERREAAVVHAAAFRLLSATRRENPAQNAHRMPRLPEFDGPRSLRIDQSKTSPLAPGEKRDTDAETELRRILAEQDFAAGKIVVTHRQVTQDARARQRLERLETRGHNRSGPYATKLLVAGVQRSDGSWMVARVLVPPGERALVMTLIGQTLFIYLVIVGAMALILRRITRPLAALTNRLERFAETREIDGQLSPEGPDDVRRLIVAHNDMEARIAGLLDEKDVMLGAIGHDLKTPLAALRVRIESVDDDNERAKMAATIEDIVRTLDDILSLARVGRPRDPREPSELSALVASVVEEYEDMDEPVTLGDTSRLVLSLRATWLRRALRNLIGNALRYGSTAHVSLLREGEIAVIRIEDDGPGIAEADIERMQEPFVRGEPSRNSETGGAGLGLALARAIAEQHGGALHLSNRIGAGGKIEGLRAEIRLPLT